MIGIAVWNCKEADRGTCQSRRPLCLFQEELFVSGLEDNELKPSTKTTKNGLRHSPTLMKVSPRGSKCGGRCGCCGSSPDIEIEIRETSDMMKILLKIP